MKPKLEGWARVCFRSAPAFDQAVGCESDRGGVGGAAPSRLIQGIQRLNNTKRMMLATIRHAGDNIDKFLGNEVANGYANEDLADQLALTLSTVWWYLHEIYKKLHLPSGVLAVNRLCHAASRPVAEGGARVGLG